MIDYLLWHPTEEAALADPALAPWRQGEGWDTSRIIPTVTVYRVTGVEMVDLEGGVSVERELRTFLEGHYMVLALEERVATLDAAPQTMLVADRESRMILHAITSVADLATLKIEPTFGGSDYPFGAPELAVTS